MPRLWDTAPGLLNQVGQVRLLYEAPIIGDMAERLTHFPHKEAYTGSNPVITTKTFKGSFGFLFCYLVLT